MKKLTKMHFIQCLKERFDQKGLHMYVRDIHIDYRVLQIIQIIQMKLILLCVWAELAVLAALKLL